jgi:hypothetical protein
MIELVRELLAAWDMEEDTPEHNHEDRLDAAIGALREALYFHTKDEPTTMKLFQIDVKFCATAYIVAEDEERAKELLAGLQDELPTGGIVDGRSFEAMLEDDEELVTISPAVTFYGAWDEGAEFQEITE